VLSDLNTNIHFHDEVCVVIFVKNLKGLPQRAQRRGALHRGLTKE